MNSLTTPDNWYLKILFSDEASSPSLKPRVDNDFPQNLKLLKLFDRQLPMFVLDIWHRGSYKIYQMETSYKFYFQWKGTGEFINTKFWCRIRGLMHDNKVSHFYILKY